METRANSRTSLPSSSTCVEDRRYSRNVSPKNFRLVHRPAKRLALTWSRYWQTGRFERRAQALRSRRDCQRLFNVRTDLRELASHRGISAGEARGSASEMRTEGDYVVLPGASLKAGGIQTERHIVWWGVGTPIHYPYPSCRVNTHACKSWRDGSKSRESSYSDSQVPQCNLDSRDNHPEFSRRNSKWKFLFKERHLQRQLGVYCRHWSRNVSGYR